MPNDDEYNPVSWCLICGWITEDPNANTCYCDDGIPHC